MKISYKHQATKKMNTANCSVTDYDLNNENLNFAIATIEGRYPDRLRVVNQECDELAYVFEGDGKIVINHQEHTLTTGDVVLIEAGEKYYWEGTMKLFVACRPAWKKDQHQMVD